MHAADVSAKWFTTTAFRTGYAIDEVDDLLTRIAATLAGYEQGGADGPVTAEHVTGHRFTSTRFRSGYDQDEVDDFLDHVVVALRRHEER